MPIFGMFILINQYDSLVSDPNRHRPNRILEKAKKDLLKAVELNPALKALVKEVSDRFKLNLNLNNSSSPIVKSILPFFISIGVGAGLTVLFGNIPSTFGKASADMSAFTSDGGSTSIITYWPYLLGAVVAVGVGVIIYLRLTRVSRLIKKLNYEDSNVRRAIAKALSKIGEPAMGSLIKALGDKDWRVREHATEILGCFCVRFGVRRVIYELVDALADWNAGPKVFTVLQKWEWQPASDKEKVRFNVAKRDKQTLLRNWDVTRKVLLADAASGDSRKVKNAVYAFVGIGNAEVLDDLIRILDSQGTREMAETFLNCGNKRLSDAAEDWAHRHGYTIMPGGGSGALRWGGWVTALDSLRYGLRYLHKVGIFLIAQSLAIIYAFVREGGIKDKKLRRLFAHPIEEVSGKEEVSYSSAFKYLPTIFQNSIRNYHVPAHQQGEDEAGAYKAQLKGLKDTIRFAIHNKIGITLIKPLFEGRQNTRGDGFIKVAISAKEGSKRTLTSRVLTPLYRALMQMKLKKGSDLRLTFV